MLRQSWLFFYETANPSRDGGAKSWICQADAYTLADRQTAELFCLGGCLF